ncbi:MAG TPA: hypothetical protein VJA25_13420 [Dehalococcoidia bacterium]|nr:hypothetical protein [Dehalococcoidia bacterium]
MPSELDALLPLAECVRPRKPRELRGWVLAKCNLFAQVPELRGPVLLHEGLFKWFHEEIYPLSVFAVARYGDSDDVFCVPKRDQSYDVDAEVREASRTIQIEITSARDPHEHLRMEYLVQHRHVSLTGHLKVQGNKRTGRQIENEVEFVDHRESRARHLGWIKTAAEGKAGGGRYGKTYELLIAVEDWWFDPDDAEEVVAFIKREVLTLPLEFDALHVVGLTERPFLSFPLGSPLG